MDHYKLRITWSKTTTTPSTIYDILTKDTQSWAMVHEHEDTNAHTHFYLVSEKKEATLRNHLRTSLGAASGGDRGNAVYSLSKMDVADGSIFAVSYLAYMAKEGTIFPSLSFDPTWIPQAIELDKIIKEEIKEKKKEKAKNKFEALKEKVKIVIDLLTKRELSDPGLVMPLVFDVVLKHLNEGGSRFSLSMVEMNVFTLMVKYCPNYSHGVYSLISKRLMP